MTQEANDVPRGDGHRLDPVADRPRRPARAHQLPAGLRPRARLRRRRRWRGSARPPRSTRSCSSRATSRTSTPLVMNVALHDSGLPRDPRVRRRSTCPSGRWGRSSSASGTVFIRRSIRDKPVYTLRAARVHRLPGREALQPRSSTWRAAAPAPASSCRRSWASSPTSPTPTGRVAATTWCWCRCRSPTTSCRRSGSSPASPRAGASRPRASAGSSVASASSADATARSTSASASRSRCARRWGRRDR